MNDAISPLDERYSERVGHLAACFSERALMRSRCEVELRYLLALAEAKLFPRLDSGERQRVTALLESFGEPDYARIKSIEATTRHDVKACELFLREKLELKNPNLVHFGLTSEDVNNLAYTLLFKRYLQTEQLPLLDRLMEKLSALAQAWRSTPFPARTHGQMASPTTAGKEMAVFLNRLVRLRRALRELRFAGKLNGATGNYAAMLAALPDFDWPSFARAFLEGLGLELNPATTQIEDHDTWATYFNLTRQVNNVLLDLDQDAWLYISYGYLREPPRAGEVGSSTMPHKVNPIRFENSEGNLGLSNALLVELSNKLCRSRMQRDLSDSTVVRNVGVALAHAWLAMIETLAGLERVALDEARCLAELEASPELLAEPIQTLLRVAGHPDPYEALKRLTRGKAITRAELERFVDELEVDASTKARLRALKVAEYYGAAPAICDEVIRLAREELSR